MVPTNLPFHLGFRRIAKCELRLEIGRHSQRPLVERLKISLFRNSARDSSAWFSNSSRVGLLMQQLRLTTEKVRQMNQIGARP